MNFIDQAEVSVYAGKGGDGRISFRHERFAPRGGPDGGDGGDGGDVILLASTNQDSLAVFRFSKELKADSGVAGSTKKKHGRNGKDLIVKVPVGTIARDQAGVIMADLIEDGEQVTIANGGKGGFGNAHFVNSRRQAPTFAEKGEPGEGKMVTLELKMLADVGLVGLPNAGKSTLLAALSNAHPKIANYPFTTLNPSVGVVDIGRDSSLLFADIPGLIEGAAEGKGLGHDFLRHIERTSVILHLVDGYSNDPAASYLTVRKELKAYQPELIKRPQILAITKTEGLDAEIIADISAQLKRVIKPAKTPIMAISAKSGQGLKELVIAAKKAKEELDSVRPAPVDGGIFRYSLDSKEAAWQVARTGEHSFIVTGVKLERFAVRTDFSNDQAQARLLDILQKHGVIHALNRQGMQLGDKIAIGDKGELVY